MDLRNPDVRLQLATRIMETLFFDGVGEEADRIALITKDGRDRGGLCRESAVKQIVAVLYDAAMNTSLFRPGTFGKLTIVEPKASERFYPEPDENDDEPASASAKKPATKKRKGVRQ